MPHADASSIRIIHYNDVYNIDVAPREPVGGAARFVTAIKQATRSHTGETMVLFSGDAFSPAPLTDITEGSEIPPILNATQVDVACIGNHELDRGLDVMKKRISETNFPWLVSNVFEKNAVRSADSIDLWEAHPPTPLGGINQTYTLTRGGVKFGFMGLASIDWLETLDKVKVEDIDYVDFCEAADHLAHKLREEQECDFVVALTHMREPDDELLAEQARSIDLILGGHDHILSKKFINGRWVVKSGTDFKNFSTIEIRLTSEGKVEVEEPEHYAVTSEYNEDPEIAKHVAEHLSLLGDAELDPIAITLEELDGRFVSIRTQETGLGNFICDAMTRHMGATIGLINAGSFRSDSIEPAGKFTQQTIDSILPFKDQAVLVPLTGRQLLAILENSVSQYPLLVGRFCQVSGVSFSFDPQNLAGQRIKENSVTCRTPEGSTETLQQDKEYLCALKSYIYSGKDGFPEGDPDKILRRSDIHIPEMVSLFLREDKGEDDGPPTVSPQQEGRIVCLRPDAQLLSHYLH